MRSTFKIIAISLLGMSLTFCSSSPKDDSGSDALPQFDDYQPVGSFGDDSETPRNTSSNPYGDDDYGDDDFGDTSNSTSSADVFSDDSNDGSSYDSAGQEPLPVEKISAPKSSTVQAAQFKNGMYKVSSNCNMRSGPSQTASKAGLVPKGKRLWIEGHNDTWVKVFKKSGPVFLHKSCL